MATKRKQIPHIGSPEGVVRSFQDCYGIIKRQSDCLVVGMDAKVRACFELSGNGVAAGIRFWDDIAYSLNKRAIEDRQSTQPLEGDPFLRL